MALVLL